MKELGHQHLCLSDIEDIVFAHTPVAIAQPAIDRAHRNYRIVTANASDDRPMYGLNTGFGALAEQRITSDDQYSLQRNIILSHAVGVGEPLSVAIAKTLMVLRLHTLAQGYSGASPALLEQLVTLINRNVTPLVPCQGSVGASGDLAPLAHLGLLLLGIGDAYVDRDRVSAEYALQQAGVAPLKLGVRDGLALINGTQAMTASAIVALKKSRRLSCIADHNALTALCVLDGHDSPFDERLHRLKPHAGQIATARNIRAALANRPQRAINPRIQDPYSLRCVPQVHGASKDVITHVSSVTECELNAVTDNPLLFVDPHEERIDVVSGGNFHGQHMAFALDYLAMAVAELANIAERRMELLLNPHHSNGLPAFLINNSGINSGYMMLQVTAAALVNENKVLTHPASTDSIPTSANREDHVSMGMTSANKLAKVIENSETVLAIECLMAHQALDFMPSNNASRLATYHEAIRKLVPFRDRDGLYGEDLSTLRLWLSSTKSDQMLEDLFRV